MARIEWEGIPERYWPDTEKPWRVSWGFGMHQDFATEAQAQAFRDKKYADDVADGGGWENLISGPYNAAERKVT